MTSGYPLLYDKLPSPPLSAEAYKAGNKRRARILALDAAAKACSTLLTPQYNPEDGSFRTLPNAEVGPYILTIARVFEAYIEGEIEQP